MISVRKLALSVANGAAADQINGDRMGIEEIEKALLKLHGVRVTPAMAHYILAALRKSRDGDISVIAGDARTGIPIRIEIPAAVLQAAAENSASIAP